MTFLVKGVAGTSDFVFLSFQIGCSRVIYLFDVLTLGAPCFDEGLQDILESGDILKV